MRGWGFPAPKVDHLHKSNSKVLKSTEWKSGLRCINVAAEARRQVTAGQNLNLLICKMGITSTCLRGWSQGMRCEFSFIR